MGRTNKRIIGLDCIKGIAIILMVYGHSTFVGSLSDIQHQINAYIYTFHMPLFYVISGYLFSPNAGLLSLKKTSKNILLPYGIFLTIYLFGLSYANASGFTTTGHVGTLTLSSYLDTVLLHPKGSYYFLHTIIVYQFSLALAYWIGKRTNTLYILHFFIISIILNGVIGMTLSYANMGFLLMGYLIRLNNVRISLPLKNTLPGFILIALVYLTYTPGEIRSTFLVQACLVFSLFFVSISLFETARFRKVSTAIAFVGKNTLVILVLHIFFLNVCKLFANRVLSFESTGLLYAFSAAFLAVSLSILSAKIFDALKVSKYIFSKTHIYQPMIN